VLTPVPGVGWFCDGLFPTATVPTGGGAVDSVNGETGVVVLDAADVGADPAGTAAGLVDDLSGVTNAATARSNLGLGNVNNTSDANKPVSTAQQTALDAKAPMTRTVGTGLSTSGTVNLDMASLHGTIQTITASGSLTFTTSNGAAGREVTLVIGSGGSSRTLAWPSWLAVGAALPTSLASGKTLVATVTFTDTTDAAADAVKRARAAAEAEKTAAQQAAEAQARAATFQKERDDLHSTVSVYATAQLSALTPEQRTAVTTLAGDNPAAQLRAIEALRATWAAPAPAAPAPVVAAPPPPPPAAPPANTAPPVGAPPAGAPPAVVDHIEVLKSLEATNPVRAARYRTTYVREIEAATKARGSK